MILALVLILLVLALVGGLAVHPLLFLLAVAAILLFQLLAGTCRDLMPVRLHEAIETRSYLTDGRRLLYIVSLSRTEALVEDASTGVEEVLELIELARPRWRRVHQEAA